MTPGRRLREGSLTAAGTSGWPVVLLLLTLCASACSYLPRNEAHSVYAPAKYGSDRFAVVNGYNLHYVEAGEGAPVLLIPGAFCTYRVWNRVIPILSKGHRVLAVDYLGVGDSDKPGEFGYSVREQADLIAAMVRQLGLRDVRLAGASYGGLIALELAARNPDLVESVTCIEGGPLIVPEVLRYNGVSRVLRWPVVGDVTWALVKTDLFPEAVARTVLRGAWEDFSETEREEIREMLSANIRTASRAAWSGIDRAISGTIDITGDVLRMKTPVLYLYGSASRYREMSEVNARLLAERLPSARVIRMAGGVHDLHMQFPERVAGLIADGGGGAQDRKERASPPAPVMLAGEGDAEHPVQ